MTSLLDFPSPPAGAYGATPLAVDEIDAHPDRDRIWATILALREAHEDTSELAEAAVQRRIDDATERAYDEGWGEAVTQGATA